jgi:16S rRNA (guanine966-N2)-methyltransferase
VGDVRITSGRLRGRLIRTPEGKGTRPLLTRVRKSLVDVLRPRLQGARVLDLFSGSGAIAFELLSNGASRATAVEIDREAAALIRGTAGDLGADLEVLEADAVTAVYSLAEKGELFDLIVVAPPYGLGFQQRVLEALERNSILTPAGLVVVQRDAGECPAGPAGRMRVARTRSYGRTVFDFYEVDDA